MNSIMQKSARAAIQLRQMSGAATSNLSGEATTKLSGAALVPQKRFGPMDPRVKAFQAEMQDPLRKDIPVYMRRGMQDKLLYYFTAILILGGLGHSIKRSVEMYNARYSQ